MSADRNSYTFIVSIKPIMLCSADSKCAENEYKCRRGPCIHRSMVCDKKVDCDLTWDDEDVNCRKALSLLFSTVVHALSVAYRPLVVSAFECSSIAPSCQCQNVYINCTGRGLDRFPYDVEKEITF